MTSIMSTLEAPTPTQLLSATAGAYDYLVNYKSSRLSNNDQDEGGLAFYTEDEHCEDNKEGNTPKRARRSRSNDRSENSDTSSDTAEPIKSPVRQLEVDQDSMDFDNNDPKDIYAHAKELGQIVQCADEDGSLLKNEPEHMDVSTTQITDDLGEINFKTKDNTKDIGGQQTRPGA
jgi:hypothetical protein